MPFLFVLWCLCSFLAGYVAKEKQRDFWAWTGLSFCFSPLIAFLALTALPDARPLESVEESFTGR